METNEDVSSWTVRTNCGHSLKANIGVHPILPTSSSLERLFNLTDIPSASEAAHVRAAIEKTKSDLEKIDEEIGALESALDRLRSNREVLEKRSQHLEAVISPVRRLPSEILVQIFVEVSFNWNKTDLLALCHVSRLWREIALSNSSLWTHISVRFRKNHYSMESQAAAVQHWLTYSRDSLLYVNIHGADSTDLPLSRNPTLELLVLQSHRWKDASLFVTFNQMSHYFSDVKGRLGKLESLKFSLTPAWTTIDYFEDAPRLRTVIIDGFPASENPYPVRLPWDSLTHLKAEARSLLAILQQCASLDSCDVTIWSFVEQPNSNFVELPHLRSFIVNERARDPPVWFYDSLSLPMLQTFELYGSPDTSSHISSFLSRSSHTLERLSLSIQSSFNITACLEVTPSLKRLTIKFIEKKGLMAVSLHRLSLDLTSSINTLLPELESLEFELPYTRGDMSSFLDDTFVAMILSRLSCKAGGVESVNLQSQRHATYSKLRSVLMVINSDLGDQLDDPFQEEGVLNFLRLCQNGGVDVAVSKTDRGYCSIHMT